jgi:hypothetical protein
MDGDRGATHAEPRANAYAAPAGAGPAGLPAAPEPRAPLYRRMMAGHKLGGPFILDLPDLAGCYDYDL